jgi:predicted PurR-regulated permease PerM
MNSEKNVIIKQSVAVNIAACMFIIAGIMYSTAIVTPLLMALFISIICAAPITWLRNKKVPQSLAIFLVLIGIIVIFIGFGELISTSLSSFSENIPTYEENLKKMGSQLSLFLNDKGILLSLDKMSNLFNPSKLMGATAGILGQLGGFMGNTLTIIFLVLFLLFEADSVPVKVSAVMKSSASSIGFFRIIGENIRHYLMIKTLTSLITGALIWILLSIMGLDYAILWALIAFLLNYIPTFGSIIAAVPAVLFSIIQLGIGGIIGTTIIFVAVNLIIGNIVEPKMMGKGLGLSTFVVFFSLLFWGFVLGTVGMFLSVPLTMAIKIMLEQNEKTKRIAIFMGTQEEAQAIVNNKVV